MQLPESKIVFTSDAIAKRIDEMGEAINDRCKKSEWLLVCIMNGGLVFTGELLKRLNITLRLDSVRVTRYHDTTSGSELQWHAKAETEIAGQSVLLVDDIFDEGETLASVTRSLIAEGAKEVVSAVLLDKIHDRKVEGFRPDFTGLTCNDVYVFGFGMDYEGYFRNLPEIRCIT